MDQVLKQRLVGVIVITAFAAIFLPMLFDNPVEDSSKMISELTIPEPPIGKFKSSINKLPTSAEQVLKLPPPKALRKEPENQTVQSADSTANKTRLTSGVEKNNQSDMLRWVIQVGSFSLRPNAIALRNKLRKQGFSAFVDTFDTEKNGKMFRLRVGPELDKKRAEMMQKKINENNNLQSILVSE